MCSFVGRFEFSYKFSYILEGKQSSNYYTAQQLPMKRKHQPSEKMRVGNGKGDSLGFPFDEERPNKN